MFLYLGLYKFQSVALRRFVRIGARSKLERIWITSSIHAIHRERCAGRECGEVEIGICSISVHEIFGVRLDDCWPSPIWMCPSS